MPRKILCAALFICLALIALKLADILAERVVPFVPQKRPASKEWRML